MAITFSNLKGLFASHLTRYKAIVCTIGGFYSTLLNYWIFQHFLKNILKQHKL